MWHQKYSLRYTKVLGFGTCRVTSKVLGISSSESSWGDVKTIKSGKMSAVSSMYQINRVLFMHMPVFNQLESKNSI